MRSLLTIFFILILLYPSQSQVQREAGIMAGTCNYLGDIGTGNGLGRPFIYDIQLEKTKPSVIAFYRYFFTEKIAARVNLGYGQIAGDDRLSGSKERRFRNLHFKSHLIEFSAVGEFIIWLRESYTNVLPFTGLKKSTSSAIVCPGAKKYKLGLYGIGGLGAFYFNPKAEYNGVWHALQPLGTEGQGLPNRRSKYSRIQLAVPLGGGFFYHSVEDNYKLGLEIGWRYTLTDYLDDVSSVYADPDLIRNENGEIAAILSNRSNELPDDLIEGEEGFLMNYAPGERRGDPGDKDSYFFLTISFSYILPQKSYKPRYTPGF